MSAIKTWYECPLIFFIFSEEPPGPGLDHFEEYEKIYPERYEEEYGYFRKIITAAICKYLDCGIMENGFARVRCPACGHDFFMAFSCKTRFFCPSCAKKRTPIWSAWVKAYVLKDVAHRQWVFTNGAFDLAASFHPLPGIDSDQAAIIFREKVFA